MKESEMIYGLHAIREAVEAGEEIDKIFMKRESNSVLTAALLEILGSKKVPIRRVPVEKLNRLTRKNHQGIVAFRAATTYYRLEEVIPTLYEAGRDPFLVLLDGVTDVRNFGAIARTCECAGVDAIVIFDRDSVSVTADAVKTSAGALSRVPVCREHSIAHTLAYLRESGVRLLGATEKARKSIYEGAYDGPLCLIVGAEDRGLSESSLRSVDELLRIPLYGEIGSLNVSVAAALFTYEVVRQRRSTTTP